MIMKGSGIDEGLTAQPVEEIKQRALEATATLREALTERISMVGKYAQSEPTRALGIAFATGVLLGWLIKRR